MLYLLSFTGISASGKKYASLLTAMLLFLFSMPAFSQTVFQIGNQDGRFSEFALAPAGYQDFLEKDFGWPDRFYLVGQSDAARDWPYILPGTADFWAGSGGLAGKRSQVLNIVFNLGKIPPANGAVLFIDLVDTHGQLPPLLKVEINGKAFKQVLPAGGGDTILTGFSGQAKPYSLAIPVANEIKPGTNSISLTILEGSWLIFDAIRLEAQKPVTLLKPRHDAVIRKVSAAPYQLNSREQPLLVDIEVLQEKTALRVVAHQKTILTQQLEKGRYILEAPMPATTRDGHTPYNIYLNSELVQSGTVLQAPKPVITPAGYVDTHLGSAHSRWMIAPGPWMPFGMVKLSPDNENSGWQAGYDPTIESIGTFSHIHEWTMAGLGIFPVNGALKTKIGDEKMWPRDPQAYRSAIDKSTEETGLGYYRASLTDYHILAELTATTRASFMKFTFPQDKDGRVMIDLKIPAEYDYEILESELKQIDGHTVEGFSKQISRRVWSDDADQEYVVFFRVEFDRPIKKFGGWKNDSLVSNTNTLSFLNPGQTGAFVEFDTKENPVVQVRTGISFVDLDGARRNLAEEITRPHGWRFESVRQAQVDAWNELLGRVQVESHDQREKMRFYTNLYRSFCRNTFSDVDGRWTDATEKIQQLSNAESDRALGCDAFWNTFWNLNQLWNLVAPEWSSKWVRSQLAMYDANGFLAKGPAGMEYIPVMVGEHEIPLMVGAYQMGIRDFDAEKLLEASIKMQDSPPAKIGNGLAGNRDNEMFLKYKYVPADSGRFSNTLEYAFDNWALGQLGKAMGKNAVFEKYNARGNYWKNAIDTATGYARMRYANGEWEKDFDPYRSGANHHYVEGNAWQLTYFVPQDIPGLMQAIGRDRFLSRLTDGFQKSEPWRYNAPGEQYWDFPVVQGNQQSMHFAFLFNWAGEPWQTQKWSRSIIDRYYGYTAADAYLGDEDQGQMSAWFVMAALGLFQTDGGTNARPLYEIGSPIFEKVTIDLGNQYGRGKTFTIIARGASRKNKYVQSARLNGKVLTHFSFPASELLKGGQLELQMGSSPNKNWGVRK